MADLAATWPCCGHCKTLRGHVVPPEGHGLPCDVKGCQFPYRPLAARASSTSPL